MIPGVSFTASKLPLQILNPSVVQHEGIHFLAKKDLLAWIDAQNARSDADVYMLITCQCGAEYPYKTREDVPDTNRRCSCGRDLIVYG